LLIFIQVTIDNVGDVF